MSVTNKTTSNTTNVTTSTLSTSTIQSIDKMIENLQVAVPNTITAPFFPYTLDYNKGSVFYIPTTYNPQANFQCIITNIPVNKQKVYSISLIYTSATNTAFFCNQIKGTDVNGMWYLGNASVFATPLYNGGVPSLTTASSNVFIQQINLFNIYDSTATSFLSVVTTSVNNYY